MLKKLTEEKLSEILECGISEFAEHGFESASMKKIAERAGISVGVLYKYYADKDAFIMACIRRCLDRLEGFLTEMTAKSDKPLNYVRSMIETLLYYSREHGDYIRMYHRITQMNSCSAELAREIEGFTSKMYSEFLAKAQERGDIRRDIDPGLFAFFFDNLLMMMQFSYACPYYTERFRLYGGSSVPENDEYVTQQLLKFMESAFTLESADIPHRKEEKT